MVKVENDVYRLNDIYFKSLMGNKHRKNLTLNFLNSILKRSAGDEFVNLKFRDKECLPEFKGEKVPALDILAVMNDGTQINIEVQVAAQDFYIRRAVYYCCRLHGDQLNRGEYYTKVMPTISIHLLDFAYFPDERYHRKVYLKDEETNEIISQDIEFHFIELPKITFGDIRRIRGAEAWFAYFSKDCSNADREVVAMNNPAIKDAVDFENRFFASDKMKRQYELSEKHRHDYISSIDYAHMQGKEEGFAEGIAEGQARGRAKERMNNAKSLLSNGLPLDIITKSLHLTDEEIEKLKR